MIPIEQIVVKEEVPLDPEKVAELEDSIRRLGLLHPLQVHRRDPRGETNVMELDCGHHRFGACRNIGMPIIPCRVSELSNPLLIKLTSIDENLARKDITAAEHAILTRLRREVIEQLEAPTETVSQNATPSRQEGPRPKPKSGRTAGSIRDQADKTGQPKSKVERSDKRSRKLATWVLEKVIGTPLNKGVELDALAKLPKAEQEALVARAARGEVVSARTPDRKPKARTRRKSLSNPRERALAEFRSWRAKYADLEELKGLAGQISEIEASLSAVVNRPSGNPDPE